MNANQLHILQHSLGCDQYGRSEHRGADEGDGCFGYYRNRYVSDPEPDLIELVTFGLLKDHGPQSLAGGMHCYTVTEHGLAHMRLDSPKPPKLTRSQQRWRDYLKVADCFESFGAYLKYLTRKSQEL